MSKFCSKCGKEFPDDAVFCGYCGVRLQDSFRTDNRIAVNTKKINMNTKNIVVVILSVALLLVMIIMPMFKLSYDKHDPTDFYSISMLGDNYMAGHGCKETINTVSKMVFIGLLGSLIGLNYFNITKKYKNSLIVSIINFVVFVVYNIYIETIWVASANSYHRDEYSAVLTPGCSFCYILLLALIICSFLLLKSEKRMN